MFKKVKEELAGLSLRSDTIKKMWVGVPMFIAAKKFATAFRR